MELEPRSPFPALERLPVALLGLGPDGRVIYANEFARTLVFGSSLRVGMTLEELVVDCQMGSRLIGDVVSRELESEHLVVAIDRPNAVGGATRRYYSLAAAGEIGGTTLLLLQDASPLIGLGTSIDQILARFEAEADEASREVVRQLANEVAHLVRNPLASLTLNATLLGSDDPLERPSEQETREIVRDIEDAARRIADVVDRLVASDRGPTTPPQRSLLGS